MGKIQKFTIDFSPKILKIIKLQRGILGNSESDVVKNIVLTYFKENKQLKLLNPNKPEDQLG